MIICLLALVSCTRVQAQSKNSQATVRGQFAQSPDPKHQIDFSEFKVRLVEQVSLPDVEPPDNWDDLSMDERQSYVEKFKASKEGKALMAKRQAILDAQHLFDIKIEPDGRWVVFDVPPGRYGIVDGRIDKKKGKYRFAYELFGQLDVSPKIEEVILEPIAVLVTPLLAAGDEAPEFQLPGLEEGSRFVNKDFVGKPLFIYFWSNASQPSVDYLEEVRQVFNEMQKTHSLELLLVNVDGDKAASRALLKPWKLEGKLGIAKAIPDAVPERFGVRTLPSLWLLDPAGKILMSHNDIRQAGFSGKPLKATLADRIDGKDDSPPAETDKRTGNKGD